MRYSMIIICIFYAFFHVTSCFIITTSFGTIEGKQIGEFHSFKKIPFAQPPLGRLRFQKPKRVEKWKGILNAKEYGPACMSNSSSTSSPQKWVDEDCLHINIFTSTKCLKSNDCAVAFYIHGGELLYDSAVMFNETVLFDTFASRDVVLVIPAFRLGFFSHFVVQDQSVAPNNLALFDILSALEFVKEEIKNFGGDCNKVTVLGHSFGGQVVSVMTFSPKINKDLSSFQRAVIMSDANVFETLDFQIGKTLRFAEHANCSVSTETGEKLTRKQSQYMMECLQKIDGIVLLRIQRSLEDAGYPLYEGLIMREPLFEIVKNQEFFDKPKNIPTLSGCTYVELDKFQAYHDIVRTIGYENYEECDAKYRKDKEENENLFNGHADETLAIFAMTGLRARKLLAKGIKTYLYEYSYPNHAVHTDDLSYIMGIHTFDKDENERNLATFYKDIFTNFVKYGEPGNGFEETRAEDMGYMNIYWNATSGERPAMKKNFEAKVSKYWLEDMFEYDRNVTACKKARITKYPNVRSLSNSPDGQQFYIYICSLIVLLVFVAGCIFGKMCGPQAQNRRLYIKLDGTDHYFSNDKSY